VIFPRAPSPIRTRHRAPKRRRVTNPPSKPLQGRQHSRRARTREGFDFTGADCMSWFRDAGFVETRVEPLVGPDSMVIGIKGEMRS